MGTNLGDKLSNIHMAYTLLEKRVGVIKGKSSVYSTPAWGFESDNRFYNTVIYIETKLSVQMLLIEIKAIERFLGREIKLSEGYTDRIIDLDILDYNNEVLTEEDLAVPHEKMHERNFVLMPLAEIAPNWIHPVLKISAKKLVQGVMNSSEILQLNEK